MPGFFLLLHLFFATPFLPLVLADSTGEGLFYRINAAADNAEGTGENSFNSDILTRCVGSSHAATALRADWQKQLAKIQADLGFEYIRFHGLLDDDMSVVLKSKLLKDTDPAKQPCEFVSRRDYCDPAGPVLNASSPKECCELCYNTSTGLPEPCIAAVYTPDGLCYTKLGTNCPLNKTDPNITACITNRRTPRGFMYSFVNIFKVFDFLRSIGMRPVVELSFMPSLLSSDPTHTGFWYRGGRAPPKDFADWRDLIKQLVTALVDRYGLDEGVFLSFLDALNIIFKQ